MQLPRLRTLACILYVPAIETSLRKMKCNRGNITVIKRLGDEIKSYKTDYNTRGEKKKGNQSQK